MRFLRSDAVVLGLFLLAALVFRWPQLQDSLWLDELHTGWSVHESIQEVAPRARMGNNHPTYFYLTYLTTRLLGNTERPELALRLPSLLAGLAAIGTGYWLVRHWTGSLAAAATTAGLLVIDPHSLFYALEARPYAIIQWLGLCHVAIFLRWLERSTAVAEASLDGVTVPSSDAKGLMSAWIVTASLLFYLHYTALMLPLVELPLAMWWLRSRRDKLSFVVCWFVFIGVSALAMPSVLDIYSRRTAWVEFISIPRADQIWTIFPLTAHVVPAVVIWLVGFVCWRLRPSENSEVASHTGWRRVAVVSLLFALPVLFAFSMARMDVARLFFRRYLIVISGLPMVLAGLMIGKVRGEYCRAAGACVVLVVAACLVGPSVQWNHDGRFVQRSREDWKAAVALLNEHAQPGDAIYIASDLIESNLLHGDRGISERFESYCALPLTGFYELEEADLQIISLPMDGCAKYVAEKDLPSADWIITRRNNMARVNSMVPKGSKSVVLRKKSPTVVRVDGT